MAAIDVCNGDADGLFAIMQLRLAEPREATLITGRKHEIALLERVRAHPGDMITVCDISLDRNVGALRAALHAGASVRYFDHHTAAKRFDHPQLEAWIDTDPALCTSLIVNRYLNGRHALWAAAAAWGDNLSASAHALADTLRLDSASRTALQELGEAVNYNAYGDTDADCLITPKALFERIARFTNPLEALQAEPVLPALSHRRREDLAQAQALPPWRSDERGRVWMLPDAPWSRRVLGPFANQLASDDPDRAHAVARARDDGSFDCSVRAPLNRRGGADRLCRAFGGGGRAAAGAIDHLPATHLEAFMDAFANMAWGPPGV